MSEPRPPSRTRSVVHRLASVIGDLRFGARHFARTPFSTATIVILLALGIGLNAALFTVLYSVINMPPPGIARDDALVRIRGHDRSTTTGRTVGREFAYPEYLAYAERTDLFSAVEAWTSADAVLDVGGGEADLHSAAVTYVTPGYFAVLGVQPIVGPGLPASPGEGDQALVAVISHTIWDRHFGRAADVVGRTVEINEVPVTVVGVAPPRFSGARTGGSQVRLWLPLEARPIVQRTTTSALADPDSALLGIVARLASGVQPEDATPVVRTIAARAAQAATRWGPDREISADVVTLLADNYFPPSGEEPSLVGRGLTFLIPLLVLLICCSNVSVILVGLAVARRREVAVRLSLGASRRRLIRQMVTESILLAAVAAIMSLLVIALLLRAFGDRVPDVQLVVTWPAIAFTLGLSLLTAIVFGLSPALHATRVPVGEVLKEAAAGSTSARSRLQPVLVVAQIAMIQPLLFALGSLVLELNSELRLIPVSPYGDRILQVGFNVNARYGAMNEEREEMLRRVRDRISSLPGVEAVVAEGIGEDYLEVAVHPEDRATEVTPGESFTVVRRGAEPGYFALMGHPFLLGREFEPAGQGDERSIVIRSDLARRLWGTADPIGRRLVHTDPARGGETAFVVVGVLDASRAGSSAAARDVHEVFVPLTGPVSGFLVRTRGPADPFAQTVRAAALEVAPTLPVTTVGTLAARQASQRTQIARLGGAVIGIAAVALIVSAAGLYAVIAFGVGQRRREIGIRTALGADADRVVRLFMIRGLRLGAIGLSVGLALVILVQRLIESTTPQAYDLVSGATLSAVIAGLVAGVALIATWIPARAAAAVDPLVAIRAEQERG